MATERGRAAVILVGTGDPPSTPVNKHFDADFDPSSDEIDATTNDSAGSKEREYSFDDGTLTFKTYTDPADSGQTILRNAVKNKTKVYVIFREQGTGSGKAQDKFQALVFLKKGTPLNSLGVSQWTLKKTGANDATAQI